MALALFCQLIIMVYGMIGNITFQTVKMETLYGISVVTHDYMTKTGVITVTRQSSSSVVAVSGTI